MLTQGERLALAAFVLFKGALIGGALWDIYVDRGIVAPGIGLGLLAAAPVVVWLMWGATRRTLDPASV